MSKISSRFFFLSFFYSSAYPNFPIFGNATLLLDEVNVLSDNAYLFPGYSM